ncbi:alpha/beta-hydrolase [Lophiostoma macrostomum CBS 122681]|uniref:Carboxypeptidase n=1 Tax=Lophiostoma macrostomum CBS 122681 TaxID=1314788 RepID=A0A6A6TG71_9PLEO|nr:alpha/beta-hydrolase [Lophiostoma macrostomum CBS 122681]
MYTRRSLVVAIGALSGVVRAQFPPTPEGVTTLDSHVEDGVKISYKENDLCETTEGVRSYSGYVHLPPGALDDLGVQNQTYEINTFFWFFESRKDPENAPLSIWMNGGPGSSSLLAAFQENGPCWVNADSNSTYLNEWSWNNEVNMLYIDQPVQVGLSYDVLTNITLNLADEGTVEVADFSNGVPEQNNTFYVGTYGSQNNQTTTRGTENSARALWNFAQVWFQEFPGYKPNDNRISIATESYGGRYGPGFAAYFQEQNDKITNGTWSQTNQTHILHLDTLFLINSCIDRLVQWPGYPKMAYNNTYGIKAYNQSRYESVIDSLYSDDGCLAQIEHCRNLSIIYDPTNQGFNETVNDVCQEAETFCTANIRDPYFDSDVNYYDISSPGAASYPPPWYEGYLNQPHVQQDLGAPLNWSQSNSAVAQAFRGIGDYNRPGWKEDLAYLLDAGIKVTLVYGDRDYACNWYGGELLSLAIPHSTAGDFASAGYTDVVVNDTYVGGQVRQHGNLSFTRVYESGHEVPAYQPETAYRIFMRALFNFDIATGNTSTLQNSNYSTTGPDNVYNITNEPIKDPGSQCYVLDSAQCTTEQWASVVNGSAEVRNWIVVDANTTSLFPDLGNGTNGTNSTGPSGTGTPTPSASTTGGGAPGESSGAGSRAFGGEVWRVAGLEMGVIGTVVLATGLAMLSVLL